jgi:formate C-acetyltransferase
LYAFSFIVSASTTSHPSAYEAAITVLESLPVWANNHAKEARRLASEESNEKRRAELLEIARICEKVPAEPAETFYEALQAYWFAHVAVRMEQGAISISMGRFDQDFIQYYENDIASGVMDMDMAEELMECLWVKLNETNEFICASPGLR